MANKKLRVKFKSRFAVCVFPPFPSLPFVRSYESRRDWINANYSLEWIYANIRRHTNVCAGTARRCVIKNERDCLHPTTDAENRIEHALARLPLLLFSPIFLPPLARALGAHRGGARSNSS